MRRSLLVAIAMALLLAGWLASPYLGLGSRASDEAEFEAALPAEAPPVQVRVATFEARPVAREIALSGRTEPLRSVEVMAETVGRVVDLPTPKGSAVVQGDVLAVLDPRDKEAVLREAEATLEQRRIENAAAERLGQKGFQAETRVAEAKAALETARAAVERARLDLADTEIKAPVDGWLDRLPVEVGSYLREGDVVARVVQLTPLKVVTDLPEASALLVHPGQRAMVRLPGGKTAEGTVRFVAKEADPETRTFRVELTLPNPDGRLPAGISAGVMLQLDEAPAQEVPTALLSLDDAGAVGVKAVDDAGVVRFLPVEIVKSGPDRVWVQGLPERVRLVTVGGGFVAPGQAVEAVAEEDVETAAGADSA